MTDLADRTRTSASRITVSLGEWLVWGPPVACAECGVVLRPRDAVRRGARTYCSIEHEAFDL